MLNAQKSTSRGRTPATEIRRGRYNRAKNAPASHQRKNQKTRLPSNTTTTSPDSPLYILIPLTTLPAPSRSLGEQKIDFTTKSSSKRVWIARRIQGVMEDVM